MGYDGTDGARAALHVAVGLAVATTRSLPSSLMPAGSAARCATTRRSFANTAAGCSRRRADIGREAAVEIELVLRELSPAEALIAVADEHDARMIVVGSHGERPLKSALVGSTPTRLLHLAERPVLVDRAPV